MYSDDDLDAAVANGALSAEAAAAFRSFVAGRHRATPLADEEQFRLLTGFNDVFVAVAVVLTLFALGWLLHGASSLLAALGVAAASWGMAEYFTRVRRMALPSILLLAVFVSAAAWAASVLVAQAVRPDALAPAGFVGALADLAALRELGPVTAALFAATAASLAHWIRFKVPITVAALTMAALGTLLLVLLAAVPPLRPLAGLLVLAGGLAVFGIALWWDMSDPGRTTRRADVAFWLHLAAAPLLVHPLFSMLGLLGSEGSGIGRALAAVLVYAALAVVALAIDRRAVLVSALAYVLYATSTLLGAAGSLPATFALAGLIIGSVLLLLSAFWRNARAPVVRSLPWPLRQRLPAA